MNAMLVSRICNVSSHKKTTRMPAFWEYPYDYKYKIGSGHDSVYRQTDGQTDGHTDRRMDKVKSVYSPFNFIEAGFKKWGISIKKAFWRF